MGYTSTVHTPLEPKSWTPSPGDYVMTPAGNLHAVVSGLEDGWVKTRLAGYLWAGYLRPATPEEIARVQLARLGAEDAL